MGSKFLCESIYHCNADNPRTGKTKADLEYISKKNESFIRSIGCFDFKTVYVDYVDLG